jgi:hypothetical protein
MWAHTDGSVQFTLEESLNKGIDHVERCDLSRTRITTIDVFTRKPAFFRIERIAEQRLEIFFDPLTINGYLIQIFLPFLLCNASFNRLRA